MREKPETFDQAVRNFVLVLGSPFMTVLIFLSRFFERHPRTARIVEVLHRPILITFWMMFAVLVVVTIVVTVYYRLAI